MNNTMRNALVHYERAQILFDRAQEIDDWYAADEDDRERQNRQKELLLMSAQTQIGMGNLLLEVLRHDPMAFYGEKDKA